MSKIDSDLIDIEQLCPGIMLDIRYATPHNFVGRAVYRLPKCFLRKKIAEKIVRIQKNLKRKGLALKIFDGYRPKSVVKIFWDLVQDERYVCPPWRESKHARGAAIDLTLVDTRGKELQMPTPFDDFTEKAHRDYFDLPLEIIQNRELLEHTMAEEGFIGYPKEWWHFDDAEWETYSEEDISFEDLLKKR